MTQPSVYYRMVTIKVPQGLNEQLKAAAEERGISLSHIIRECCTLSLGIPVPVPGDKATA